MEELHLTIDKLEAGQLPLIKKIADKSAKTGQKFSVFDQNRKPIKRDAHVFLKDKETVSRISINGIQKDTKGVLNRDTLFFYNRFKADTPKNFLPPLLALNEKKLLSTGYEPRFYAPTREHWALQNPVLSNVSTEFQ